MHLGSTGLENSVEESKSRVELGVARLGSLISCCSREFQRDPRKSEALACHLSCAIWVVNYSLLTRGGEDICLVRFKRTS